MNISSPRKVTLGASVLLAVLAFIAKVAAIAVLAKYAFHILAAAFVILLLGCLLKKF